MKKLIALVALAISTPAMGASLTASDVKLCKLVGISAKSIMTGRQEGIAPTKAYEVLDEVFREDMPYMMELIVLMIREAYDKPSYFSDNLKKKAIRDYETQNELECLESVMETNQKAAK